MIYFHNINLIIPVEPITQDIKNINPIDINSNQHWLINENIINENFLIFLNQLDLRLGYSNVLFYTPPHGHLGIHIDGNQMHNNCMMNWAWGSKKHKMSWYELISNNLKIREFSNKIDNYVSIDLENAKKIDSQEIQYPSLVKIGIPHSIENYDSQGRWCLSLDIRLKNKDEEIPGIDFESAKNIFLEYVDKGKN